MHVTDPGSIPGTANIASVGGMWGAQLPFWYHMWFSEHSQERSLSTEQALAPLNVAVKKKEGRRERDIVVVGRHWTCTHLTLVHS